MKKILLLMMVLSFLSSGLFAGKVATLNEVLKPGLIAADDTQLYVTEDTTVFIYSLKDYKLVKKFGKMGQGPQEFVIQPLIPLSLDISTDNIIVNSLNKLSFFTKKGDFIKEIRAMSFGYHMEPLAGQFVGKSQMADQGVLYDTVNLYDIHYKAVGELCRVKAPLQPQQGKGTAILQKLFTKDIYKDKIILPGKDDGSILVYQYGNPIKKLFEIKLNQDKIRLDNSFKEKIIKFFKTDPSYKNVYEQLKPIVFPDYFPTIADFFTVNDTLYVMTWKMKDIKNGKTTEFFTYDINTGKLKKLLYIPIQFENDLKPFPLDIRNSKLYQLVENFDAETWELYISQI